MKHAVILFLTGLSLWSCDPNRIFESYKAIGDEGWHKDTVAVFSVDLHETRQNYNLFLNIRNQGNYPNSNLWLFVDIQSPDGKVLTDTIEFVLADIHGKWTGSGIGDLFDNQFLYKQNVYFPVSGEYRFSIRHGMRANHLKGIRDVGFRIEKRN
ncbi:gliding motility lipoprotein GldH [Gaoshiqia sp. Z1-71]|uniref:gliding motility lipoprotein GldH n=1 Tax=Gaoshiqia hydrogeniformans TaxID=3290090 RepID=UPI003BF808D9